MINCSSGGISGDHVELKIRSPTEKKMGSMTGHKRTRFGFSAAHLARRSKTGGESFIIFLIKSQHNTTIDDKKNQLMLAILRIVSGPREDVL